MGKKLVLVLLLFIGATGSAWAQAAKEFCVYCQEPDRLYRCSVIGAGQVSPKVAKLYCIVKTARDQKHSSCRVRENASGVCQGTEVTYLYEGPSVPGFAVDDGGDTQFKALEERKRQVRRNNEPETLVEFTGQSLGKTNKKLKKVGKNTKNAIKKTGKVIGKGVGAVGSTVVGAGKFVVNTTANTVKCIFTLFSKCGAEPAPQQTIPGPEIDIPVNTAQ